MIEFLLVSYVLLIFLAFDVPNIMTVGGAVLMTFIIIHEYRQRNKVFPKDDK